MRRVIRQYKKRQPRTEGQATVWQSGISMTEQLRQEREEMASQDRRAAEAEQRDALHLKQKYREQKNGKRKTNQ